MRQKRIVQELIYVRYGFVYGLSENIQLRTEVSSL